MPDQGDQVDLERAAKAKRFVEFVTTIETETIDVVMSAARAGQLGDALYTAAELNLLKMEGSIEIGAAIRIHAIVSSVMAKGFPARLRM